MFCQTRLGNPDGATIMNKSRHLPPILMAVEPPIQKPSCFRRSKIRGNASSSVTCKSQHWYPWNPCSGHNFLLQIESEQLTASYLIPPQSQVKSWWSRLLMCRYVQKNSDLWSWPHQIRWPLLHTPGTKNQQHRHLGQAHPSFPNWQWHDLDQFLQKSVNNSKHCQASPIAVLSTPRKWWNFIYYQV